MGPGSAIKLCKGGLIAGGLCGLKRMETAHDFGAGQPPALPTKGGGMFDRGRIMARGLMLLIALLLTACAPMGGSDIEAAAYAALRQVKDEMGWPFGPRVMQEEGLLALVVGGPKGASEEGVVVMIFPSEKELQEWLALESDIPKRGVPTRFHGYPAWEDWGSLFDTGVTWICGRLLLMGAHDEGPLGRQFAEALHKAAEDTGLYKAAEAQKGVKLPKDHALLSVVGMALVLVTLWLVYRKREAPAMERNRCPECGKINRADAKFCKYCGTKL